MKNFMTGFLSILMSITFADASDATNNDDNGQNRPSCRRKLNFNSTPNVEDSGVEDEDAMQPPAPTAGYVAWLNLTNPKN